MVGGKTRRQRRDGLTNSLKRGKTVERGWDGHCEESLKKKRRKDFERVMGGLTSCRQRGKKKRSD